jgi:hypothetical protein
MPKFKIQMTNECQSSNDKMVLRQSNLLSRKHEKGEEEDSAGYPLTFRHLELIWHLDFII